jgi:hypothetical protein
MAAMPTHKLTTEIITAAIQGFESQKKKIDLKIAEHKAMLSPGSAEPAATTEPTKRKRRKMSGAARARIAEAQKARWQAFHKQREPRAPHQRERTETEAFGGSESKAGRESEEGQSR